MPTNPGTTGLIEYYAHDEASGTRAGSHAGITLTDNNTVGSTTGVQSNASVFVAANSEYLSTADTTINAGTGDLTVAGWVYPSSSLTALTSGGRVWQRRGTGAVGTVVGFSFCLYRPGAGSDVAIPNTIIDDGAGKSINATATSDVVGTNNSWIFIVYEWDAANDTLKVWADNTLIQTYTGSTGIGSISNNSRAFTFGASDDTPTQYFDGRIDEVSIWSRKLSADEQSFLYNGGAGVTYATVAATGAPLLMQMMRLSHTGGFLS